LNSVDLLACKDEDNTEPSFINIANIYIKGAETIPSWGVHSSEWK